MVLQNYQNFTEITSNMIYIVAFGVGLKCPHKIHLNTQCPPPYFVFSKNAITILSSVRSISSEVLDWAFIFIPKFAHFDCPFFMLIRETIWVCEDCVIATADHTCCMHAQKGQKFSKKAIFIAYL